MDAESQWTGLDPARLARIGDHLEREYLDKGRACGFHVAVVRRGHIAYVALLGQSDLERGRPVREDTLWRIYSMTKPITSVALMMLYERGRFQLDEPVARYAPSWSAPQVWVSGEGAAMRTEAARRPVTFRDLLSHAAGLTYGGLNPNAQRPVDEVYRTLQLRDGKTAHSMEDFLDKLGQVPLAYQPGAAWAYSLATDACGALVEVISGRPFASFLQDEIFAPLAMRDTGFVVPADKLGRLAANYRQANGKLQLFDDPATTALAQPPVFVSGGGGLVSTTADYLRFCEMLRRGGELDGQRILGPRTVELMHQNHLPGCQDLAQAGVFERDREVGRGVGFGLGFAMSLGQVASGGLGASDYYWSGAAGTLFWVDPQEELSVVFMTQVLSAGEFNLRGELKSLIYSAIVD